MWDGVRGVRKSDRDSGFRVGILQAWLDRDGKRVGSRLASRWIRKASEAKAAGGDGEES